MRDINNVTLTGRLTRDAELKYLNSGMAISKFSIASNYSKKSGDQWEDVTNFFDCTLFGKIGEVLAERLRKGCQVTVSGELRQERWEKEGEKKSRISVIVNNILLGSSGKSENSTQQKEPANNDGFIDDDLDPPF